MHRIRSVSVTVRHGRGARQRAHAFSRFLRDASGDGTRGRIARFLRGFFNSDYFSAPNMFLALLTA
jgi:hypothetical protein